MEKEYSKRELDSTFDHIKESLLRIELQTTKTNGRVTVLEKWVWGLAGAIAIGSFLGIDNLINLFK